MYISIIIVNYNVCREVDNCLQSIYSLLKNIDIEVIVVDNNSPQRDILDLENKYPKAVFKFLNENLGFGKANNYGINLSKGKFVLLLNPDTVIVEDFISPIIAYIENKNNIGACGPMLLYDNLSFQNSFGNTMGAFYDIAEALMFINLYRKLFYLYKKKDIDRGNAFKVGWLSAACILIKAEVIKSVKGFNENYFLNYEDIDLCRRVEKLGYLNYYFPAYKCIHLDHSSQKKDFEKLVFSRYQSRKIYASTHYGILTRWFVSFFHIVGLFFRIITVVFLYSGSEKKQRLSGYKNALKLYFN